MKSEMMTTRELHTIRKKMWDASMANHERYFDETTGEFAGRFTEFRSCPVCGSNEARFLFKKSGGNYVACNVCAMVYLNPVFKDCYLEEYYGINHAVQSEIVELDSEFYRDLYQKGINTFAPMYAENRSLLDVGCSAGSFLDLARENGWNTFGIELNKTEFEYSKKKGHGVYNCTIQNMPADDRFDVITLWDVFEHIKDGKSFIKAASRLLKPDGGIFIQSPTSASLAARMLQEKCNMFDGLEHVNLYSYQNVKDLAEELGFHIASYKTVITEIGVMNNFLQYEDAYLGSSQDRNSLLGLLSSDWILSNKLGYKFQIFMKKN